MGYNVKQSEQRRIAGFHLVGPWEEKVKQGFQQLLLWVEHNQIQPLEWVSVYYDNPDEVPPEKLRCDVAITVERDFQVPVNSAGVITTDIPGGHYAVMNARVYNEDFEGSWNLFLYFFVSSFAHLLSENPFFADKECMAIICFILTI